MYQIGAIAGLPFVGPCVDTWGRKVGMLVGSFIIILGVIINGTTIYNPGDSGQLQAGRFILGFGVSIVSTAGPVYVVETAHLLGVLLSLATATRSGSSDLRYRAEHAEELSHSKGISRGRFQCGFRFASSSFHTSMQTNWARCSSRD